jgi:uncharacterized protein (DUF58 family)
MIYPVLKDLLALKRIKNPFISQQIAANNNFMFGNFTSKVIGQGLNFESNREYVANDDLRHINWRLTAKNNKPFVKTYTADTDQTILAVIDGNSYMHFGTKNTFKSVQAINCAALIAWQCLAHKERIGFYYAIGSGIKQQAVVNHEGPVIGFFKQLCAPTNNTLDMDFATVVHSINQQNFSQRIIYLISDFINASSERLYQEIKIMQRKHKVVLISIYDKFDYDLPNIGNISMVAPEQRLDLCLSAENIKKYNLDWHARKAELDKLCLSLQITNYWVNTEQKWMN